MGDIVKLWFRKGLIREGGIIEQKGQKQLLGKHLKLIILYDGNPYACCIHIVKGTRARQFLD